MSKNKQFAPLSSLLPIIKLSLKNIKFVYFRLGIIKSIQVKKLIWYSKRYN